ncbi:MAG: hypothetical protein R3E53_02370 [Myxococcota bacterium]
MLLKVIDSGRNPADVRLADVMTPDPESLRVDAKLAWALNMMSVGGFRHLPIVNEHGWPVFILSVRLIVDFLVESFPAEILNLPRTSSATGACRATAPEARPPRRTRIRPPGRPEACHLDPDGPPATHGNGSPCATRG